MSATGGNSNATEPTSQNIGANKQELFLAELVKSVKRKEDIDMLNIVAILNPKTYDGTLDPVVLEDWLRSMDKLFELLRCPDNCKVRYAVFYLEGRADAWWAMMEKVAETPEFGWEELKDLMRKRFFPVYLQHQETMEFLKLKQGNMSVIDYNDKFLELRRVAPCITVNEEHMIDMFTYGLKGELEMTLSREFFTSYTDVLHRAMTLESVKKEAEEEERKQQGDGYAYRRGQRRRC